MSCWWRQQLHIWCSAWPPLKNFSYKFYKVGGWICCRPSRVLGTVVLQTSRWQAKGMGLPWEAECKLIGILSWPLLAGECISLEDRRQVLASWLCQWSADVSWLISLSCCVSASLSYPTRDNALQGKVSPRRARQLLETIQFVLGMSLQKVQQFCYRIKFLAPNTSICFLLCFSTVVNHGF